MAADVICEFEPSVHHGTHKVDAAARTVVFVTGFDIRRTGGRTQSAVHTVEKPCVFDAVADLWKMFAHNTLGVFSRSLGMIRIRNQQAKGIERGSHFPI